MLHIISLFRYAKDDDPDNPEDYLAPDIEPPSVFGNLVSVIVAEHNLVCNVSTSQVAEELAKEAKLSDCSLDEGSEVGEGKGGGGYHKPVSASMQVLANVVVL